MVNQVMSKYSIITLDKVSSTNSYALENISNLADRTVIYTPHQTSGRGRYNRVWVSDDSENIYVSFVLKPEEIDNFPFVNLTQYLSIILCRFLENEFSLTPSIKWPNDILIDGYKISGILAESFMQKNELKGVVLGLGLNVNLKKETIEKIDQKAVSLFTLTGCKYAPKVLLEKICNMFFKDYDAFISEGFKLIQEEYIKKCSFLGKNITIKGFDSKKEYFAEDIDENGFLITKDNFGKKNKIITGDVLC